MKPVLCKTKIRINQLIIFQLSKNEKVFQKLLQNSICKNFTISFALNVSKSSHIYIIDLYTLQFDMS